MSTQILEKQDITPEISDKFTVYLKTLHCSLNTTQFSFAFGKVSKPVFVGVLLS